MPESKKILGHNDFLTSSANPAHDWLAQFSAKLNSQAQAECFRTRNKITGNYQTLRLRQFGRAQKDQLHQTLIIPPLGVHDAGITDLAMGNSLIESLLHWGLGCVHLVEWGRVTPDTPEQSIDSCLADINIAIDDLGGTVNLIGLSIGGLHALLMAARFPQKIERLVLAGTPIDMEAQLSTLTLHARKVTRGGPNQLPIDIADAEQWLSPLAMRGGCERAGLEILQRNPGSFAPADLKALRAFEDWSERKFDRSGSYMRDLLTRICAANEIARGDFVALGRRVDLKAMRAPIFVLSGERDDIAPPRQALAALSLVGTAHARKRHRIVKGAQHLSLFAGQVILQREWTMIAGWLQSHVPVGRIAA